MKIKGFNPTGKQSGFLHVPDTEIELPYIRFRGLLKGPSVVITAGVHAREYTGIDTLIRLGSTLDDRKICGNLTFLPCVNYRGFIERANDVIPFDQKNLNRVFPGKADGSQSEKLADYLVKEILTGADYLIDLHAGGYCESLVPHVYYQGMADVSVSEESLRIARMTSVRYAVKSTSLNTMTGFAGSAGIPGIILERGGMGVLREEEVLEDMKDVMNILRGIGILQGDSERYDLSVLSGGIYLDSPSDGCWKALKKPGDMVKEGELLGVITDIFGEILTRIYAQRDGVILYQTESYGIQEGEPLISYGYE